MQIINSIPEMQTFSKKLQRSGKTIGFVPTMGFLHEGHLSLIDEAQKRCDEVIVSIYVNPTQFGPNEDLDTYPRDFERDAALCEERGVTAIFHPADSIYPADFSTWVNETKLSQGLCGKYRPEHFQGVTTIVTKLFNAVLPDLAVFGQKDAQQSMVIKRMVEDLNFPIEVVVAPIIREADGLAMSSRNKNLTETERKAAVTINQSLKVAKQLILDGELSPLAIESEISERITESGGVIDYVDLVTQRSLEEVTEINEPVIIAVAAHYGKVRLIDNIFIEL